MSDRTEIEITVFEKHNGPFTKRISQVDGKIVSDSSSCWLAVGRAHRVKIDGVQALADLIDGFKSHQMYTLGSLKDGLPDNVEVVVKDKLNGAANVIARSRDFLVFKEGEPGAALLDVDLKGIPEDTRHRIEERGGAWGALCDVLPALKNVARVERASTSSGLRHKDTGETCPSSDGCHIVVLVLDAADVPRFLYDFDARCWLKGFGWGLVSGSGKFLKRSLVDKSCGTPEHPIFEGPPILGPSLVQEGRIARPYDGFVLDTRALWPPLTDDEKAELQKLIAAEEQRVLPELQATRKAWGDKHVERLVKIGKTEAEARALIDRWFDEQELTGEFKLPFDDPELDGATVAQVLAASDKYVEETLSDPLEGPGYGRGKAILYQRPNGSLWIKSFAHGGIRYELKTDLDVELERLARLPDIEYEQERGPAAARLNVRVTTLDKLVDEARARLNKSDPDPRHPKTADVLIGLSDRAEELFHAPDGTAYATIPVGDHLETWALRSKGFRRWLVREFFVTTSSAPNSEALQSALNVIEAKAHYDGPQRPVYVRVAAHDGRIYLDLADDKWRAVEISSTGWQIIDNPPIRFRRSNGMLPLPEPIHGGKIEELRPFLNVGDDDEFVLTVSFVLATYREGVPYPVLDLSGEHGSAKSTFAEVLRKLVDPNSAPLRALPREERDLAIGAKNAYLLVFDNLSKLPDWLSDALARLATGAGFGTRELHTDDAEALFDAMRPIILNGIEDIVLRGDLAERSIKLVLKPITEYTPEKKFWADFGNAQPGILGVLLDGVSHGLRQLPGTRLGKLPRMADFALWAAACETAYWEAGTFLAAYEQNLDDRVATVLEADHVATTLQTFMAPRTEEWEGTATRLLGELITIVGEERTKELARLKQWPIDATRLSGHLRRFAATLRKVGVDVTFDEHARPRTFKLVRRPIEEKQRRERRERRAKNTSQDFNDLDFDAADAALELSVGASVGASASDAGPDASVGDNPLKNKPSDATDAADAEIPPILREGPGVYMPQPGADAADAKIPTYSEGEHETPTPPSLDQDSEVQGAVRLCAQCGAGRPDDQPTIEVTGKNGERLWLHRECLRFWRNEHPQEEPRIEAPADAGGAVINFPAPAGGAAKPSYKVMGWARPGSLCGLCGKPVSVYRINYDGQEYTVHLHHAAEYVKALAHPPHAAQPRGASRSP